MSKLLSKFTVGDTIVRFDAPAENLSCNIPSFCNSIHVFPLNNRRARVLQSVVAG